MTKPRTLILFGHPNRDSFNGALADAYTQASPSHVEVERIDLGALSFDPVLRHGFAREQPLEPDLERARRAIERADHLVWVFPTWWAAPPTLVRGFVERVFLPGWAFRYHEGKALPETLLAGRSARVISTMDSPSWWYRFVHRRSSHRAFVTGTLRFCGIGPVSETTVYSLRERSESQRERQISRVAAAALADARRKPVRARKLLPNPQSAPGA